MLPDHTDTRIDIWQLAVTTEPTHLLCSPAMLIQGLLVGLLGYIGFGILRRRKAKRMTAYAALQDDPTF